MSEVGDQQPAPPEAGGEAKAAKRRRLTKVGVVTSDKMQRTVAVIKPGRVIYEMEGVPVDIAKEAMRLAAQKLTCRTKFVQRV